MGLADENCRSEDKADHAYMARELVQTSRCAVAVPNYRLTRAETPLLHPAHAVDVLAAFSFLLSWGGTTPPGSTIPRIPYDNTQLHILAHSCGAHIVSSVLLDSSMFFPKLTPHPPAPGHPGLLDAVQSVIFTEGIYDLDLLLASFPDYRKWFIAAAFGPGSLYPEACVIDYPARKHAGKDQGGHIRWLIINSEGDAYVDATQAKAMYKHLVELFLISEQDKGQGEVTLDLTMFTQGHDDILKTVEFIEVAGTFVHGRFPAKEPESMESRE
jgi:acetyl esterase/lipase